MIKLFINSKQKHEFHLVDPSPWPFAAAFSAFMLTLGGVTYMHGYQVGNSLLFFGFFSLLGVFFFWWRDVVREGTFEFHHSKVVVDNLCSGMFLFIISEIMFFSPFLCSFLYIGFNAPSSIGGCWPPVGIHPMNPFGVPLLNTILLASSGATITWAHFCIKIGLKEQTFFALSATIFLALIFTGFQYKEYISSTFSITDTVFGSSFFMLTGLHGFHVIVGTTFLIVCLIRLFFDHFKLGSHLGFDFAAWYWHFVDIVWFLLYIIVYYWAT